MNTPVRDTVLDKVRTERDRFVAFAFAAADMLLEVDDAGKISYAAGAAKSLTAKAPKELEGQKLGELLMKADRSYSLALLSKLSEGDRLDPSVVRLLRLKGDPVPALLGGCRLRDRGTDRLYVTLTALPVGAEEMSQGSAAEVDPETGLLSAKSFEAMAKERVEQARALNQDVKVSLLSISADKAEEHLEDLAAVLRSNSLGGVSAGRLGDDKFGVIHKGDLPEAAVTQGIAKLIEGRGESVDALADGLGLASLTLDMADPSVPPEDLGKALAFAFSTFVSQAPGTPMNLEAIRAGVGDIMKDAMKRMATFRNAVTSESFDVHIQPIVGFNDLRIHHYEALARFADGASTFETINFAEEVGVIHEFDLVLVRKVLDKLVRARLDNAQTVFAANLSARSVQNEVFLKELNQLLAKYGSTRKNLMIEITESSQIRRLDLVQRVIEMWQKEGHEVCLDDFGAGASGFQYVKTLKVDVVKIDGAYVKQMGASERERAIVKSMVTLCRDLGVKTIAEMVETEEQAHALKIMGADFGQGWYYGKPLPTWPFKQTRIEKK